MTRYDDIHNELADKQYTWLVTGEVDFIGSNLVEKLIGLNQRVVGLDNFETGHRHDLDQAVADAKQGAGEVRSDLLHFFNGEGETSRDFCFIDNAVQINIISAISQIEEACDQVFNCALNDLYKKTVSRFIEHIEELKVFQPMCRDFRQGDLHHSLADISKAQSLVGYEPGHHIAAGLDEAMDWSMSSLS